MKIKIKQLVFPVFFIIFMLFFQRSVFSAQFIQIDFFYSTTCPHCAKAKEFLTNLKKEQPQLILNQYEISQNNNRLIKFYKNYKVDPQSQGLIPVIFIDKQYFIGFSEEISNQIKKCIIDAIEKPNSATQNDRTSSDTLTLPFIGKVEPNKVALPVIAIILGIMDGFNVCSLGALLIILALVLSLKSRLKTLIFGGSFILTTALIYGLLIFFWYQLFNIISPYLRQMEIVIGILTVLGGTYFLKEFIRFRKQGPTCEIGTAQKIEGSFSKKFQSLIDNKAKTLTIFTSILLFAVVITVVEFPCSAAVPVAFAGILTKAQLSSWLYLSYIILYVIFYMFDELLVFFVAFFTMKLWLASPKFITWITLVESIIMFLLGAYYLF
ncbi:hypothetical protein AUK04_04175 [Candidatus Roizmanbacteria bacterium CG2_30_33_16]|nr:hypothetical protein [Candidatus Roizmanbacteria bacterium]OIP82768.1 MAG: hypothetical protein AUK04_04175 [Candidatus Roizmanbacteria bacterium CG2_30_33_16]PIV11009.1 MAG: hypothetical protein COS50_02430 [Candidatus Roizmanbacteria bacterium CG03_land_8_20_14_0_80_35_26]